MNLTEETLSDMSEPELNRHFESLSKGEKYAMVDQAIEHQTTVAEIFRAHCIATVREAAEKRPPVSFKSVPDARAELPCFMTRH